MKKSKLISLVLVCAALASCNKEKDKKRGDWRSVNYRTDDNASYNAMLYYMLWTNAFRPYGYYNNGVYTHYGYEGQGLSKNANYGVGTAKSSANTAAISRGGFGRSGARVSS